MLTQGKCEKEGEALHKKVAEYDLRIRDLEIDQARIIQRIEAMINRQDGFANWIKAVALIGLTGLFSIIAWVIQYMIS